VACVGPGRDASLALCRGAFAIPNEIPNSLSRIEKGHEKGARSLLKNSAKQHPLVCQSFQSHKQSLNF